MMELKDAMFQMVLAPFTIEQIRAAFIQHVGSCNALPTPADIKNIIQPPPVPLSGAVYFEYKRKAREGAYLLPSEREYCAAYEAQEYAKCRGGTPELQQYQAKLEAHKQALRLEFDA